MFSSVPSFQVKGNRSRRNFSARMAHAPQRRDLCTLRLRSSAAQNKVVTSPHQRGHIPPPIYKPGYLWIAPGLPGARESLRLRTRGHPGQGSPWNMRTSPWLLIIIYEQTKRHVVRSRNFHSNGITCPNKVQNSVQYQQRKTHASQCKSSPFGNFIRIWNSMVLFTQSAQGTLVGPGCTCSGVIGACIVARQFRGTPMRTCLLIRYHPQKAYASHPAARAPDPVVDGSPVQPNRSSMGTFRGDRGP